MIRIDLSNNFLEKLNECIFSSLDKLEFINLSFNNFKSLSNNTFLKIQKLNTLCLTSINKPRDLNLNQTENKLITKDGLFIYYSFSDLVFLIENNLIDQKLCYELHAPLISEDLSIREKIDNKELPKTLQNKDLNLEVFLKVIDNNTGQEYDSLNNINNHIIMLNDGSKTGDKQKDPSIIIIQINIDPNKPGKDSKDSQEISNNSKLIEINFDPENNTKPHRNSLNNKFLVLALVVVSLLALILLLILIFSKSLFLKEK